MLHTLYSLNEVQERSNVVLAQQHYNIFDSREFKSDLNMDDSFAAIKADFIRVWNNTIKPFIDAMMNSHNIYLASHARGYNIIIPEEAIYLNLQNLSSKNIKYFYSGLKGIRLLGIESDKPSDTSSLAVFSSPVYDPIHKEHYSAISIILYKNILTEYKDNPTALNNILLRIANILAMSYIDNQLVSKHNVIVNRLLASITIDSNKDAIILPESFNLCDTKFVFNYFYTLFGCLLSVLNRDYINEFTDYSSIISLPDIFNINITDEEIDNFNAKIQTMTEEEANFYSLGFKHKIYKRIWDYAKKGISLDDEDYVDICASIMKDLSINLDTQWYEAQEEYAEESQYSDIDNDEYTTEEESDGNAEGPTT